MLYSILPSPLFTILNLSFSLLITRIGKEELAFLLLITCSFVGFIRRSFLFLWVLRKGCLILL